MTQIYAYTKTIGGKSYFFATLQYFEIMVILTQNTKAQTMRQPDGSYIITYDPSRAAIKQQTNTNTGALALYIF